MAPAKDTNTAKDADMFFILNAIAACEEFKLNPQAVAKAVGINHANHVYPKLHKLLAKHGFKYVKGRIVKDDGDEATETKAAATPVTKRTTKKRGVENGDAASDVDTPTKPPAKKATSKATPKPKKRNREDAFKEEEDDGDITGTKDADKHANAKAEDVDQADVA